MLTGLYPLFSSSMNFSGTLLDMEMVQPPAYTKVVGSISPAMLVHALRPLVYAMLAATDPVGRPYYFYLLSLIYRRIFYEHYALSVIPNHVTVQMHPVCLSPCSVPLPTLCHLVVRALWATFKIATPQLRLA
jgi:hypothetical protein